jgi:hypothetical protein
MGRARASSFRLLLVVGGVGALSACGTHDSLDLALGTGSPTPTGTATSTPTATPTPTPTGTPPPAQHVSGQSGSNFSGAVGMMLTATLPAATSAGDLIAVAIAWNSASTPSVSDDKNNVYAMAGTPVVTGAGNHVAIFYAKNILASGSPVVTFTLTNPGAQQSVVIAEFSGTSTGTPLDGSALNTGTGTTANSNPFTPTQSGDIVFGASSYDATSTLAAGNGYTMVAVVPDGGALDVPLAAEFKIYNSVNPVSASFTMGVTESWATLAAGFRKPHTGGGGGGN